jgi:hypothetical protein
MVGLGEDRQSVLQVMDDMRAAGIDFFDNWSIFATNAKASQT